MNIHSQIDVSEFGSLFFIEVNVRNGYIKRNETIKIAQ